MHAFLLALVVVFAAEFGDKSQLLALSLAARRPVVPVLAGVALAAVTLQGLSVAVGAAVGAAVPASLLAVVSGAGFLLAALLTLRGDDDEQVDLPARSAGSTVLLAFGAMFLAELGDKTMLAGAALATRDAAVPTWLGGSLGFFAADALAVLLGMRLFRRLRPRTVRLSTAALLAVLGVVLLLGAL